ncbi:hypothetical protein HYALB_00006025 [Hymenoscyphus albidus]|uniref:Uncharacterized protein n=1 Tax=Hymenoscyphus albidus TaxID=595503 RepID=A0A9N9M0V5_9HELO|nr:hypothetical protein HYALB_00006025 [Hymenoscyphus albidus]
MWDQTSTSQHLSEWVKANVNNKNATTDFEQTFTQPMGIGQSFTSCDIAAGAGCKRVDCLSIENPGQSNTAWSYLVVLSMANFKEYLSKLFSAVNLAREDYNTLQVSTMQKFYSNNDGANLALKEILAAIGTAVILAGVVAGGPVAGVATNILTGAIGNGIMAVPNSDSSLAHISIEEGAASAFSRSYSGLLVNVEGEFKSHGPYSTNLNPKFEELLAKGAWLDYNQIPILNSVDDTKVKAGNNDSRLKLYYEDMGCYFQSIVTKKSDVLTIPTTQNPPGWGFLDGKDEYPFTTWDAIKGSVDAGLTGGYAYKTRFNSPLDNSRPHPELFIPSFAHLGLWNIPICRLTEDREKKMKLKDMVALLNGPDEHSDFSFCHCTARPDKNGAKIRRVLKLDLSKECKKIPDFSGCRRSVASQSGSGDESVLEERCTA